MLLLLLAHRLESMLGLSGCTLLEELYLSHNGIWKIEGLETLTNLKVKVSAKVPAVPPVPGGRSAIGWLSRL
jgi:hypothetical protein